LIALSACVLGVAQDAAKPMLHADRVLALKKERTLQLLSQGKVIHCYRVALGGDPVLPKTQQGHHKTPEGV
jgi:murein L,D-transpeptidase YafK